MRLTREGKRFLLATVLLMFAAYNTGNNLIYLVLALMLSVIAVSIVALFINMRGLSLKVDIKGPVYAGEEADLEVSVINGKRLFPTYSVRLILPEGISGKGVVALVAPSSEATAEFSAIFEKRGVFRWHDFKLESGFPFIFLTKRITVPVAGILTVYPRIIDVEESSVVSGEGRSTYSIRPGRGEELLAIREFRAGDDIKRINWKATAKARSLMVKELEEDQPMAVNIILDDIAPFDAVTFELAVSYAASLAYRLLEDGYYVGLVTAAKRLPYGSGQEQLYRILEILAVARETENALSHYGQDSSGANILILKSSNSPLRGVDADSVVYASQL